MSSLDDIARACERLRRLPESRWNRAPMPPMGARDPGSTIAGDGVVLAQRVRDAAVTLMQADARARGVRTFDVDVTAYALPDVLEALATSCVASGDADAARAVDDVAEQSRDW